MAARHSTRPTSGTDPSLGGRAPASTPDETKPLASASATSIGLWPMFFLAGVNLVDQVDMAIVRGVLPILEDEWGLSDLQLGSLGFAFVLVNAIATIPAGWLADNFRRTRIIGWTMATWTGLLALSATAVNYLNLLGARAVMGLGQSFDDPASTSLIGDYYPPRMRARVFSLHQVALFAGSGLGIGLGGFVGDTFGWRWAFVLVGMPGSLLAIAAFRLREPVRGDTNLVAAGIGRASTETGGHAIGPRRREPLGPFLRTMARELNTELRFIFGIRTMRYILVGVSALLFTVSGIGFWLAVYHERFSGMSLTEATAFTAAVLGVGGTIGTLSGGALSDRLLASRGPASRIQLVVWSACGCAALFMISFAVASVPLRLGLQFVSVASGAAAVPGLRAAMLDVIPAESRGVGASAFSLASIIFGTALAPPLVGLLSDLTGSLVAAFYIVFPPVTLGLLLLLRATKTIVVDAQEMITALTAHHAGRPDHDRPGAD